MRHSEAMLILVILTVSSCVYAWTRQRLGQSIPLWITESVLDLSAITVVGVLVLFPPIETVDRWLLGGWAIAAFWFPTDAIVAKWKARRARRPQE